MPLSSLGGPAVHRTVGGDACYEAVRLAPLMRYAKQKNSV